MKVAVGWANATSTLGNTSHDSSSSSHLLTHYVQLGFREQQNAGLENSPGSPDSIKELIKI